MIERMGFIHTVGFLVEEFRGRMFSELPDVDCVHGAAVSGWAVQPTFHLATAGGEYVLRKKPPGTLLASAHAIEREFRVMQALAGTDVPVPHMRLLCEDPSVIGTSFYVMDFKPGRIFADRSMPGVDPAHRAAAYADIARVLARLHAVDPVAVGLGDFGRTGGYVARQIDRWTRQYRATRLEAEPAMDRLIDWLTAHLPRRMRPRSRMATTGSAT